MVGSFVVLAILFTLRIWWGTIAWKFSWMSKVLSILNYGIYIMIAVFAVFVIIALVKHIIKVFSGKSEAVNRGKAKAVASKKK